jgi:hypothetical protein
MTVWRASTVTASCALSPLPGLSRRPESLRTGIAIHAMPHLPEFRLLPDFAPLPGDPDLIPAARSLVPAASSSGGMIALTAPAAAPAMTLTAVFLSVFVAPLFLLATRLPPDFVAPVLDPPDREDDFLRPDFAGILFLPVMAFG